MCGVPYHAAEGYIARLIQKGYRVAICDQMEDPRLAKKLVKREVTRIVTPGTAMDANLLRSARKQLSGRRGARRWHAPASPTSMSPPANSAPPKSTPPKSPAPRTSGRARSALPRRPAAARRRRPLRPRASSAPTSRTGSSRRITPTASLRDHFHLLSLDGCGLANRPAAVGAAGAILHYLRETQRAALDHLDRPAFYDRADAMVLDAVTVRNLELVEPIFAADAGGRNRRLPCWPCSTRRHRHGRPSAAPAPAAAFHRPRRNRARLDAVGELLQQTILRAELRKELAGILDLERLLAKVTLGTAGPRDVLALGRSLEKIPALKRCFDTQQAARLRSTARPPGRAPRRRAT